MPTLSCKTTGRFLRQYSINEQFFDNINFWDQKQAYFLGWLMSDGSNGKNGLIRIRLQEKDKKILEILKNIIGYAGQLKYEIRTKPIKNIANVIIKTYQNRWGLCFTSRKISNALLYLGVKNDKTNNIQFPEYIKNELIPHFLRSFYEGDGTISYCYDNRNNKKRLLFEIHLQCQPEFCTTVKDILDKEIGTNCRTIPAPFVKNGNVIVKFSGNLAALKFFNFVYKDADYCLKRKFRKFLHLINYMKRHDYKTNIKETNIELEKSIQIAKHIIQNCQY